MKCGPAANKFGEFVVKNFWDEAIEHFDRLARKHYKSPQLKKLQAKIAALSPKEAAIVRECVVAAVGSGLQHFLFALYEAEHYAPGITMIVDGVDIVKQSDGLHGETFGPDGWMAKFSKHPEGYPEYKC